MKRKKTIWLIPLIAVLLCSCTSNKKTRHEISEYKAGDITVTNEDDSFKILQLTDIHLSIKDNQKLQLDFLSLVIDEAKSKDTNLIVLTGDSFTFADKRTVKRLFSFLDSKEIPWTITFGNHDEQGYFSVTWLTGYLNGLSAKDTSFCVFKDIHGDDISGSANFFIDIHNKDTSMFEKIIILDSNRYYFGEYWGYDFIKQDQIDWYERVINIDSSVESLMFFHIPFPQFLDAYTTANKEDIDGENGEGVSAPKKYGEGLFEKIVELGSTKGVFVGHDHVNDSAVTYKGVLLSYGVNSTDRIYSDSNKIGGQIIKIDSSHNLSIDKIKRSYDDLKGGLAK